MVDAQQLTQWKQEWRRMVADNITDALSALEERLPNFSPKFNILIALRGQLNDANRDRIMGVVSNEGLQLAYNRIRQGLLELIDALEVQDFLPPLGAGEPNQRGLLLHKIPGRMEVGKEVACIIRLAFDEAAIVRDIDLDEDVEVKHVAVSKVMHAELIDPNEQPAFAIRTYSDEEQFLEKGQYTEWKYYVKPLREGTFALLLKVSVVEKVDGVDRRRNLTWEEKVQIVTETVREEAVFQPTGVAVGGETTIAGPEKPRAIFTDVPGGAVAPPRFEELMEKAVQPAPPMPAPAPPQQARRRRINVRRLSVAATILLVVGFALFQIPSFYSSNPADTKTEEEVVRSDWEKAENEAGEESFEQFLNKYPDAPEAEEALWELAKLKKDSSAYRGYLSKYPEGEHAEEARLLLGE